MLKITASEVKVISEYIKNLTGIYLDASKGYLLETRLSSIAESLACKNYLDLQQKASQDVSKKIERQIVDAISTNETLFFRDKGPFELLQHKLLPELIDARGKGVLRPHLRIWSAAASTGQELYSVAIVIRELLQKDTGKYGLHLFGTDISDTAIQQASYGKYNKFEIERGLDGATLRKYFTLFGDSWKVRDELRAMVKFQKFNLMHPFTALGKFDVILCRNVAIYFTTDDRKKLFDKLADSLANDGFLIIGSTESLTGICSRFEPRRHLRSIFYQKK